MAYFPLFIDLTDKTVLIVGGGAVAARKAETMLGYGPRLLVCAPHFVPELRRLSGVELLERAFAPELLEGVSLVLAATDDRALNRTVSQLCRERSIPVNVADDKELCTFLFPSILRRGPLSVGVSTGGASPTAAAYVRRTLEAQLPDCLEDILTWLEGQRTALVRSLPQAGRGELLSRLFYAALEAGRPLSQEETKALLGQAQEG